MAASDSSLPGAPLAGSASGANQQLGRRNQIIVGAVSLIVILIAAAFVGMNSGWDSIGRGGINRSLLPKVGEPAPDFTTEDVFGNPVSLSQFRGQPVWLMFWGSWCPPCRAEFPDIQAAYSKLEPQGIRMLGVSLRESPLDAAAYAARNGATFLVLSDPDESDTGAAYPILNFPTHIFIDKDGIVRSVVLEDMDEEQAIAEASRILDSPESAST
jgi:cytochrome c biogenesis protein CcmG/thiol:disulfide interchange protein DsbE